MNHTNGQLPPLIKSLMQPNIYDHTTSNIELIETHISWVILTGPYAYKIKKPLDLGFLDFSTLEKRRYYCEEELRLNQRLAPVIYLTVEAVRGTVDQPKFNGAGEVLEYAVKMVQFPQEAQLDRMLARDELLSGQIDKLALLIADFHQNIDIAEESSSYGDLKHVYSPIAENFTQILQRVTDQNDRSTLTELENWSKSTFEKLTDELVQRKHDGFIRECHGDLHLRNLAWYKGSPIAFDCLEFNANLRWIDVMSEVAFLVMDLEYRKQKHFAMRFLNEYLATTGDYAGLQILRFYLVYRALVRAKVDAIRFHQDGISSYDRDTTERDFRGYLQLAKYYTQNSTAKLIITRGMSASGKSTLTQPIVEHLGAIRIRSDVERKRLFSLDVSEHHQAGIEQGLYTPEMTGQTYKRLYELADLILETGYSVIVDATFLQAQQRKPFELLATEKGVSYRILEFLASPQTLRDRITKREKGVSDANRDVLEHQLKTWMPLEHHEEAYRIEVNTEKPFNIDTIIKNINEIQQH